MFGAFVSEVFSRCTGISIDKVKEAAKNGKNKHQSLESQIYNVTIDVLNKLLVTSIRGRIFYLIEHPYH